MAHTYQDLRAADDQSLSAQGERRAASPSGHSFKRLPLFSLAIGLLVMATMFLWSFHLENDFSGQYGSPTFHHQFWLMFFTGALLYLLGCVALGTTTKMQTATLFGITVTLAGVVLFQVIMPKVNFHGWTGASAYISLIMLSSGGVLVLSCVGLRYLWRKFRTAPGVAVQ